jgi:hypothetical protein
MEIDEAHRRGISTRLQMLDRAMCEFRHIAEGRECRSSLYTAVNDLADTQRKQILELAVRIQSLIQEARDTLDLEGYEEYATAHVKTRTTVLWAMLVETGASGLRGYGDPSEEFARFLKPLIAELTALVSRISDIVTR